MKQTIQQVLTSGLLRTLAALPYGLVARSGEVLGKALYSLPSKRKHILRSNLLLCFPEIDESQREVLARATLAHVIRSYLERGMQWYASAQTLLDLTEFESAIELTDSYAQPTIFLGFHFAGIEAGCMAYAARFPVASLYTPMSDQPTERIARAQRARFGSIMIPRKHSAREAIRILKSGTPLMLAADMDFGLRDSAFVPFFGVQACTLTAVSRLARLSGARVVPFTTRVLPEYRGYRLKIFEPLPNYPCGDDEADALLTNQFLEGQIRSMPDQYYWVHRRFKRRPEGEASVY